MGNGFSIDGNNYLASYLNQLNKKGAKPINYVSNPNKPKVESTGDVDYKELLGATFSTGSQTGAVFTDADLQGLTDMAMTDTMATTVSGIEAMADADFDIDELDGFDELTAMYTLDNYGNGTATRVGAGVSALDAIADGDPELMDIAGLLFQDAAYQRETV